MLGRVEMQPLVCAECGRKRLVVAMAPWRAVMLLCRSCKAMTAVEGVAHAVTSPEEAASRGLPKPRGGAKANGTVKPTDVPEPKWSPSPKMCAELEENARREQDGVDLSEPILSESAPTVATEPSRRRRR